MKRRLPKYAKNCWFFGVHVCKTSCFTAVSSITIPWTFSHLTSWKLQGWSDKIRESPHVLFCQEAHPSIYSWTPPVSHAPASGATRAARFPQFSRRQWLPAVKWPLVADCSLLLTFNYTLITCGWRMNMADTMRHVCWPSLTHIAAMIAHSLRIFVLKMPECCCDCPCMSGCSEVSCAGEVDGKTMPWGTRDRRRYLVRNCSATRCLSCGLVSLLLERPATVSLFQTWPTSWDSLCFSILQCFFNCCKRTDLVVILLRVFPIAVMHLTCPLLSTQKATTAQRRLQFLIVTSRPAKEQKFRRQIWACRNSTSCYCLCVRKPQILNRNG